MAKATYLRLKRGPQTLTIMGIVGEPLYRGGTIRITDAHHLETLIGKDTTFKTEYQDGTTGYWFEDVTDEYAARENGLKAKPASIIGQGERTSSELENDNPPDEEEGEEEGEEEEEGSDEPEAPAAKQADKPAAKPAVTTQRQRGTTTAKEAAKK